MRYRTRLLHTCLALCVSQLLAACGGGSISSTSNPFNVQLPASVATPTDPNVALIEVKKGPTDNVNIPYVSVTVCSAGGVLGSSNCKTIDNVLLDTGSTGLRLFASQLSAASAPTLAPQTVGSSSAISECANFLNNNAWGAVKLADVVIAGERAQNVPIQLMDANDAGYVKCTGSPLFAAASDAAKGKAKANTQILSANGILGLSLFTNDGQNYFNCTQPGALCQPINPAKAKQVQNPVALFAVNNNGVVVQMPSLAPNGAASSAMGYLVFGVGTQSNNLLGDANIVPVNASGFFTTVYRGTSMVRSFMDSGSNGLYFTDPAPTILGGTCNATNTSFYCPSGTRSLSASIQLANGSATVNFSIANADTLFSNHGSYAFDSLGGTLGNGGFDWGLPFFFGRSVYTVIEGTVPNNATGSLARPFHAFTN